MADTDAKRAMTFDEGEAIASGLLEAGKQTGHRFAWQREGDRGIDGVFRIAMESADPPVAYLLDRFTNATSPEKLRAAVLDVALHLAAHVVNERHGRTAYDAYAESTGGKTYDGRDMPSWDTLPFPIRAAWRAAAKAARFAP